MTVLGGVCPPCQESPRELARARRVRPCCDAQDALSRAMGTKAGACRLGDAALVTVTSERTGHNGSCPKGQHQAAPLLFGSGDRECSMQGEGWAGWGPGRVAGGVSNPEREPSPSGQGTVPPSGLGEEVLRAPSGARDPERLWGCAGGPWLHGTLLWGRERASADSARVSLALSRGTAQTGAGHQGGLGRTGPMLSPARACGLSSLLTAVPKRFPGTARGSHPCSAHKACPCSLTPSPTQPYSAPFSPTLSRPWLRQSPSFWLCWPSSTG